MTLGGGKSTHMGIYCTREVRCGFGEGLAHAVFVFLGFSSGPGVAAAVGSLLKHQCSALLPCPGSFQRCGAPHRHPFKSLSPFKAMCAAESVSGPTVALGGLWERPFQATGQPTKPLPFSAAFVLTKYF